MSSAEDHDDVRRAYDLVADSYAALLPDLAGEASLDRAMIAAFAKHVLASGRATVADVGCGAGRMTAHLSGLGLDTSGFDLSPGMIAAARREHPEFDFTVAALTEIPLPDATLGGVLAWYSIIHTPPEGLPAAFQEVRRVLAPRGVFLLGFQSGQGSRRIEQAYGHTMAVDAWLHTSTDVSTQLEAAGLTVNARLDRAPDGRERTPQALVLARL